MGGPSRGPSKKAALRSAVPSQTSIVNPSSGTTVVDDTMTVPSTAATELGASYITPQGTQTEASSRLSQSLEPLISDAGGATSMVNSNEVSALGAGVSELISTMNELEKLGFSNLDISLAKCVVCGDQSAGKSSVIEAISGIKVPRAAGTCTRCPMFIKLDSRTEPGSDWSAKVCIRKGYMYMPDQQQMWGDKFAPWVRKESYQNEVPFAQTTDRESLANILVRAQLAILNPSVDHTRYIPGSSNANEITHDKREAEFSPNVLCIYISGHGLSNLSFFDLPGVIITRGQKTREVLKKFIGDLVSDYIADPNALVLLTSSLEIDWLLGSNTAELVHRVGAVDRCVGVLTKPDRIDNDTQYQNVRDALAGVKDELGHGYFVVKQPTQDAINKNITHRQAREQEESFFDEQEPWATTDLKTHRYRFGTLNLQRDLSDKLASLSLQALPGIWEETTTQINAIDTELSQIPRPPSHDVTGIVRDLLRDFTDRVSAQMRCEGSDKVSSHVRREGSDNASTQMRGKGSEESWKISWDEQRTAFAAQLESLYPIFQTSGQLDGVSFEREWPDTIDLCSDEDEDPSEGLQPLRRKLDVASAASTPSKKRTGTPLVNGNLQSAKKQKRDKKPNVVYNLDETRKRLHNMSSAKVGHRSDPKVVDALMLESVQLWDTVMAQFFTNLGQQLAMCIEQTLQESLGKWATTLLYREIKKIVERIVAFQLDVQRTGMGPDALKDELSGPYCFDKRYFDIHLTRFLGEYKQARINVRRRIYFRVMEQKTMKVVDEKEQKVLAKKEPLMSKLARDPYEQEVDAIAQVRSYYELAYLRFHEKICMRVESQLFRALSEELFTNLKDELSITDDKVYDRCVQLLAEDEEREIRRRSLEGQKIQLLTGRKRLQELGEKYNSGVLLPSAGTTRLSDLCMGNGDKKMAYA